MGVMPIPKLQTLYLFRTELTESLSVGELGRLHFTAAEKRAAERLERLKGEKEMAFTTIDVSTLPVREFGRSSTEPKIGFSEGGRFMFNKFIQEHEAFKDAGKLLIQFDGDNRLLGFRAFGAEAKVKGIEDKAFLKIVKGKKDGSLSASGAGILGKIGYDFAAAGNQSFTAKFDEKSKMFIVAVPKDTPAKRPITPRKKKEVAAVTTANGANGAVVAKVEAPAEAELLEL